MSIELFVLTILAVTMASEAVGIVMTYSAWHLSRQIDDPDSKKILSSYYKASLASIGKSAFWMVLLFFDSLFGVEADDLPVGLIVLSLLFALFSTISVVSRVNLYRTLTGSSI